MSESSGWPEVTGYEILAELGHGGIGVVYKARHLKLNRTSRLARQIPGNLVWRLATRRWTAVFKADGFWA
jgi:hypothetical protein